MEGVRVPEGLAAMAPGAGLGAVLAGLDPAAVANADTVVLLQAWSRQLAHVQARFVDAVVQVGRATPFSGSAGQRPSVAESARRQLAAGEWATGELAAALRWTHRYAEQELGFAEGLVGLAVVFAALDAGVLDRGRAWTFTDVLGSAELTAEQVGRICEVLVPRAARWTTGQLRARLLRMILEIDPGYAARRYRAAVRDRGVVGYLGKDGTGTVSGHGLAAEEAVAACERLEALADQVRRAGHPGTLPQIRADLFTRLLDGRFQGLTRAQMIAAMLAEAAAQTTTPTTDPEDTTAPHGPAAGPATDHSAADHPTTDPPTTDGLTTKDAGVEDATIKDAAAEDAAAEDAMVKDTASQDTMAEGAVAEDTGAADATVEDAATGNAAAAGATVEDAAAADATAGRSQTGAVGTDRERSGGEIRVGLATLLHRDERPGAVPGWGPVLAEVARVMVAQRRGAQWRFAVTDPDGYLIFAGVTRRRPGSVREGRGGVVEVHVPAALLTELATDTAATGEWAGVVADIAGQYLNRDHYQAVLARHPGDRFARAALRRHVQVRDRRCIAPGCRRPARRCALDHTIDHALGGDTVAENSGPLCLRHHLMKHQARWRLEQPEPGVFRWISPLGQVYHSRGEPICPPEGPLHPRPQEPDSWWKPTRSVDGPIMHRPPPPDHPPPPRPTPPPDNEPPPF